MTSIPPKSHIQSRIEFLKSRIADLEKKLELEKHEDLQLSLAQELIDNRTELRSLKDLTFPKTETNDEGPLAY